MLSWCEVVREFNKMMCITCPTHVLVHKQSTILSNDLIYVSSCFYTCVCVCVCIGLYAGVHQCTWRLGTTSGIFPQALFEAESLISPELVNLASRTNPAHGSHVCLPAAGITRPATGPRFFHEFWRSNSGGQVYSSSTLLTDRSPLPLQLDFLPGIFLESMKM